MIVSCKDCGLETSSEDMVCWPCRAKRNVENGKFVTVTDPAKIADWKDVYTDRNFEAQKRHPNFG